MGRMGGGVRWVGYSVVGFTFFSVIDLSIILWRFDRAWTVCRVKEGGRELSEKEWVSIGQFCYQSFYYL